MATNRAAFSRYKNFEEEGFDDEGVSREERGTDWEGEG